MRNLLIVLLIGLGAGILDLVPLLWADVPLFNMLAIIAFWLSTSFFIDRTHLFDNALLNGLVIAVILMVPMALAVAATNPRDFAPMMLMAILLGPFVGLLTSKFTTDDRVISSAPEAARK